MLIKEVKVQNLRQMKLKEKKENKRKERMIIGEKRKNTDN